MTPDDKRHGTVAGHCAGCREDCCDRAKLRYDKRRRLYGPRTTDATGTRRRIQALQALGWPLPKIAEAAGLPARTLHNPLYREDTVYVTTAEAVGKAYDELSMKLAPGPYAERSRKAARTKGLMPPLAWDDDRIDDPTYRPPRSHLAEPERQRLKPGQQRKHDHIDEHKVDRILGGEKLPTSRAEKEEVLRRWVADGGTERDMCRRQGWREGRYVAARAREAS